MKIATTDGVLDQGMYGVTTEPALIRPIVVCHLHVQAGLQYIKQSSKKIFNK